MKIICLSFVVFLFTVLTRAQSRYSVIIDEIMVDPSPAVGLPNYEWVELKNTSASPVNLDGWRLGDHGGQSGALPAFILQPDSFVVVCGSLAATSLSAFGPAVPVTGFPSLDNDGDEIFISDANGSVIHALEYSSDWYGNDLKKEGGWTLEMIDTKLACISAANWKASTDPKGGTPGFINSVDGNIEAGGPVLRYAFSSDSLGLVAVFDEPVDSLQAANPGNFQIDGGLSFSSASPLPPLYSSVALVLTSPMLPGRVYNLGVSKMRDCSQQTDGEPGATKIGLPVNASPGDLVINEILYDPPPNGYDYVEFLNISGKIIDSRQLFIANRNNGGTISSIEQLSKQPFYVFPGDYFVVTENRAAVQKNFLVKNPSALIELQVMPSFPNDQGDVVLLNGAGIVVDEVKYSSGWQFKLINDPNGVALERIDPFGESQNQDNWHSAASTAGFGTPSYRNSQYLAKGTASATIAVSPKVFSPDNDGHDDITTIQYAMQETGWVANITVFDIRARPVRFLVNNALLGLSGQWNWNGLDENGHALPEGIYVVLTEIFNLKGERRAFKNVVVLARKM